MTDTESDFYWFVQRLVEAGWSQKDAEAEWINIQDERSEDWEGQL